MQHRLRNQVIAVGIALAIGFMLALVGPFGSYGASLASRIGYWVPLILIGYLIMRPGLLAGEYAARRLDLPRWPMIIVALAVSNIVLSIVVYWFNGHWPGLPSGDRFLLQYSNVGVITLIVFAVYMLVDHSKREAAQTTPQDDGETGSELQTSRFHERLPPGFALKALEMEDHYVRAHGQDGRSELILMRLRDAMAELAGIQGAQTHRSWWVSRGSIEKVRREGRALRLDLGDGLMAPVARDRVAALRAMGWPL